MRNRLAPRYLEEFNFHVKSYTWKRLGKPLNMKKTVIENGVLEAEALDEMLHLGIDPDDHVPTLHIYFNDDLTEA